MAEFKKSKGMNRNMYQRAVMRDVHAVNSRFFKVARKQDLVPTELA